MQDILYKLRRKPVRFCYLHNFINSTEVAEYLYRKALTVVYTSSQTNEFNTQAISHYTRYTKKYTSCDKIDLPISINGIEMLITMTS